MATFTSKVKSAAGQPTGTVVFFDGSTALGSAALASGTASISSSSLAAGSHSITASYQGAGTFVPSTSAAVHQVVNIATTLTSLTSSQNPAVLSESVTYTATAARQYGGAAGGTVIFQDGGSTVATETMAGNQAAYTVKYKVGDLHTITAIYSGDNNNTGSESPTLMEYVGVFPVLSVTLLGTSGSPSLIGQNVTFTAVVTPKNSSYGAIPDGELVTFYDGTTKLGSAGLASGRAVYATSSLAAKTHTIKATYVGDAIFRTSSGTVKQVVDKYAATTALNSSLNPSNYGQAVTFTAAVTSAGPTPTGKVKFADGATSLGSATLSGGVATLTKSKLAVGTHAITAEYTGDANSAESPSSVVDQVVE